MSEPTRAIARYDGPRTNDELREYAQLLAFDTNPEGQYKQNNALPVAFRGNPGAVAFAVEYGKALDVSPVTALIGIHIVDGKPTASAGLISALVRRAGHKIRTWTEGTVAEGNLKGITTIVRADDPEFEYRVEWTLDRAQRAGLCTLAQGTDGRWIVTGKGKGGSNWQTYTEAMVKARSITECARDAAEDSILGVHYTPEELGVEVDEAGEPVYTVTTAEAPQAQRQTPAPTPAPQAAEARPLDSVTAAEVDELRDLVLDSQSKEELEAVWLGPIIAGSSERAAGLTTGDADGNEVTLLDVFQHIGQAVGSGNAEALAATRARFGLVEVTEDSSSDDDGEAGSPAQGAPETPQGPTSDAAAPEAAEPESGAQAAKTAEPRPEGPQLRTLLLATDRMTADQRAAVLEHARAWNVNPRDSEEAAAKVCSWIVSGQIAKLVEVTRGTDPDPRDLVSDAQAQVARELEEAQAEAREEAASVTRPPARAEGKAAATAAARKAAKDARESGPRQ